jgi:beta-galactosidase
VRWAALTDKDGSGLLVVGMPVFDVSAWPYTMEQLEKAGHIHELPEDFHSITLNIDYKQMGVGGDDSWGARTHREYMLPAGKYSYRFCLRPYTSKMGDKWELARVRLPAD